MPEMKLLFGAGALVALGATMPVIAAVEAGAPATERLREADDACLQNNRLWTWSAQNTRTINITDRTNKKFTIHLAGGCVGLTNLVPDIEIRGLSNLSCVRRGDFVRFVEPSLGRMSCAITSVERIPDKPPLARDQSN